VGETAWGAAVSAGTGDNMGAGLGLGLRPGDAVVSIGTSGTVFAVSDRPTADASGTVAGFADATGRFLPLVCTLNAARILSTTAAMLAVSLADLDALALSAPAGAGGLTFVPYLDGERTPNAPDASGSLLGMTRTNLTPAHLARAAVEGLLCGLADGMDALRAIGVPMSRALLVGGGAKSAAVQQLAADILGVPVVIPAAEEYVARGAARQAAWALRGGAEPPEWPLGVVATHEPGGGDDVARRQYAEARALWVRRR
jgi:xylulokinase